jgi:serine phosphatase RsbU (regulator of sigma subunit)
LLTETVRGIWHDNQDGLWLALDKGMARLELNTPVTRFGETEGLKGNVNQIVRVFNNFYVATDRGLYMLSDASSRAEFRSVDGIVTGTHTLVLMGRKLWAVSGNGFFTVENDTATAVQPVAVGAAHRSRYVQGRVYFASPSGFGVATLKGDSASVRQWRLRNLPEVEQMEEDDAGALILLTRRGIYRLYFPGNSPDSVPVFYNLSQAQPLPAGPVRMFRMEGQLAFGTRRGVYTFSGRTGRFSPDTSLGAMWNGRAVDYVVRLPAGRLLLNAEGRVWLGTPNTANGGYEWEPRVFARFPRTLLTAMHTEGNARQPIVWLGAKDGLLRFDTRIQKNYGFNFLTQLRGVGLGPRDSLLFGGAFRGQREGYVGIRQDSISVEMSRLENGFGRIRFTFSAPAFDEFTHNQYNFKLEGWDSTWNGWSSTGQVDYNNLPIGEYTFRVKGRNLYGTEGEEVTYHFEVLPLWHETWWAAVLFIILGLAVLAGVVYAAVRYYGYRQRVENERLQRLVDERTAELRESNAQLGMANSQLAEQNEEISRQKAEIEADKLIIEQDKRIIEEKNEEIEESIVYAFRIQTALLPAIADIQAALPQSFVFWRPKDIVSGDFFWFSQVDGLTLITAADCTGHGVPGAFMTMIGNTLLNEIVRRDRVTQPHQILERLHIGVRRALSQDKTASRDGMDLAFVALDTRTGTLHFAGANNPLVLCRNGEAERIDADKLAIGGSQFEDVRRFTPHSLQLQPGDTFYLFTDGFQDQFGGPDGRKYMTKKFRALLASCSTQPIGQQRDFLEQEFLAWLGDTHAQVDDVLVIGVQWNG